MQPQSLELLKWFQMLQVGIRDMRTPDLQTAQILEAAEQALAALHAAYSSGS